MPIESVKQTRTDRVNTEETLSGFQDYFLQPIIKDRANTEDTLSGFQEFFLQPIIKDRSNNHKYNKCTTINHVYLPTSYLVPLTLAVIMSRRLRRFFFGKLGTAFERWCWSSVPWWSMVSRALCGWGGTAGLCCCCEVRPYCVREDRDKSMRKIIK